MRPDFFRLLRPTISLAALVALSVAMTSCAESKPESAEGDIVGTGGLKIHYVVQLVQSGIEPVAYKVTLSNTGKQDLTFKPAPPDCTLYLEPNSYTTTPFRQESATGLQLDENGAMDLKPNNTCTLQLAVEDMKSPLRGGTHDCQLAIQPQGAAPASKDAADQVTAPPAIKSGIFRIYVP